MTQLAPKHLKISRTQFESRNLIFFLQEIDQKPSSNEDSLNTVDTLFSSISNVESTLTINAYGIKIAEAIEVIEYEEKEKHLSH